MVAKTAKPKRSRLPFIVLVLILLGLVYKASSMTGTSPLAAVAGPQQLLKKHDILKEGEYLDFPLSNSRNRKVEVTISAGPKKVNLVTMDDGNFLAWKNAKGSLTGGAYKYIPALSTKDTTSATREGVLPEGSWHIVVERPRESIVFTEQTSVDVVVLGY
jgi:hypothetical protein